MNMHTFSGVLRDWHLPPPSISLCGSFGLSFIMISLMLSCTRHRNGMSSKRIADRSFGIPMITLKACTTFGGGCGSKSAGDFWGRSGSGGRPASSAASEPSSSSSSGTMTMSSESSSSSSTSYTSTSGTRWSFSRSMVFSDFAAFFPK